MTKNENFLFEETSSDDEEAPPGPMNSDSRAGDLKGEPLDKDAPFSGASASVLSDSPAEGTAAYERVMGSKRLRFAVTLPRCSVHKQELYDFLLNSKRGYTAFLVAHEEHHTPAKGDAPTGHLHAFLHCKTAVVMRTLRDELMTAFDTRCGGRPFLHALGTTVDVIKWYRYVQKEGAYLESDKGYLPALLEKVPDKAPKTKRNSSADETEHEFYLMEFDRIAREEGVTPALAYARENMIKDYVLRRQQLVFAAEQSAKENVVRKRFDIPVLKREAVNFLPWQRQFMTRLEEPDGTAKTPQRRVIHWVWGSPNQGKSYLYDYLMETYETGAYDAGHRTSVDQLAHTYDSEGVVLWDLSKNFDYDSMSGSLSNILEVFSEYGRQLRSHKYTGRTTRVGGHVVVFANRPPMDEILHRDVQVFHIDSYNERYGSMINIMSPTKAPQEPLESGSEDRTTLAADEKFGQDDRTEQRPVECTIGDTLPCDRCDYLSESMLDLTKVMEESVSHCAERTVGPSSDAERVIDWPEGRIDYPQSIVIHHRTIVPCESHNTGDLSPSGVEIKYVAV